MQMAAYTNGTTLARKVRTEGGELSSCLRSRGGRRAKGEGGGKGVDGGEGGDGEGGVDVGVWQECTTRACNWVECILGAGLYGPQLRHWLTYFGPDSFLLLEEEQLRSQPQWVAAALTAFLALPKPLTADGVLSVATNHTHTKVVLGDALRRTLRAFYDEHLPQVRRLFADLAPPGSQWAQARWLSQGAGPAN